MQKPAAQKVFPILPRTAHEPILRIGSHTQSKCRCSDCSKGGFPVALASSNVGRQVPRQDALSPAFAGEFAVHRERRRADKVSCIQFVARAARHMTVSLRGADFARASARAGQAEMMQQDRGPAPLPLARPFPPSSHSTTTTKTAYSSMTRSRLFARL